MAADARAFNPVALEALINGSFIVARRALPGQVARHGLLELAVLLKGQVAGQGDFFIVAPQAGSLHRYFAPGVNDVTGLLAVPMGGLFAPCSHLGLNLFLHDPSHDR